MALKIIMEGNMDKKTKDLIAVGATVAVNCQPCLQKMVEVARAGGADEQDILTAITIGKMVNKGAAEKMDGFVTEMFKDYSDCMATAQSPCGCS